MNTPAGKQSQGPQHIRMNQVKVHTAIIFTQQRGCQELPAVWKRGCSSLLCRRRTFWIKGSSKLLPTTCRAGCSSSWYRAAVLCRNSPMICKTGQKWKQNGGQENGGIGQSFRMHICSPFYFYPKWINLVRVYLVHLLIHSTGAIPQENWGHGGQGVM